jgi:hypothetical protein
MAMFGKSTDTAAKQGNSMETVTCIYYVDIPCEHIPPNQQPSPVRDHEPDSHATAIEDSDVSDDDLTDQITTTTTNNCEYACGEDGAKKEAAPCPCQSATQLDNCEYACGEDGAKKEAAPCPCQSANISINYQYGKREYACGEDGAKKEAAPCPCQSANITIDYQCASEDGAKKEAAPQLCRPVTGADRREELREHMHTDGDYKMSLMARRDLIRRMSVKYISLPDLTAIIDLYKEDPTTKKVGAKKSHVTEHHPDDKCSASASIYCITGEYIIYNTHSNTPRASMSEYSMFGQSILAAKHVLHASATAEVMSTTDVDSDDDSVPALVQEKKLLHVHANQQPN